MKGGSSPWNLKYWIISAHFVHNSVFRTWVEVIEKEETRKKKSKES